MGTNYEMLVRLDGEPEPLSATDVEWACIAPCGCTVGCMVVETTDPRAAGLEMWGGREQYERHVEDGYTMRLERRDAVLDRMLNRTKCSHKRNDIVRAPDGYRWAERGGSRRAHLVPDGEVRKVNESGSRWFIGGRTAALCEAAAADRWRDSWGQCDRDYPRCRRCESAARGMLSGASR